MMTVGAYDQKIAPDLSLTEGDTTLPLTLKIRVNGVKFEVHTFNYMN